MKNVLREFRKAGQACPECGQAPKLVQSTPVPPTGLVELSWVCEHSENAHASCRIRIASLILREVSSDNLALVIYALQRKNSRGLEYFQKFPMEMTTYDTKSQILQIQLYSLADARGVKVRDHISNGGVQFESLWEDIVSKSDTEDITRWLASHFTEPTNRITRFMDGVLQTELQRRQVKPATDTLVKAQM